MPGLLRRGHLYTSHLQDPERQKRDYDAQERFSTPPKSTLGDSRQRNLQTLVFAALDQGVQNAGHAERARKASSRLQDVFWAARGPDGPPRAFRGLERAILTVSRAEKTGAVELSNLPILPGKRTRKPGSDPNRPRPAPASPD